MSYYKHGHKKQRHYHNYHTGVKRAIKVPAKNKIALLTYCTPVDETLKLQDPYKKEVIIFTNGFCKVGIDVWRELEVHDTSSHPVSKYRSIEELEKEYELRTDLGVRDYL